ncbi:recombinase family protein [Streptomyces sp. NPDC002519]
MTAPPLAYIYDRCATSNTAVLSLRLAALGEYVQERGWHLGGTFVDHGDDALTSDRRPEFESLVCTIREAPDSDRVCLLYDWGRLSHDVDHRQEFVHRVLGAGGWLANLSGETVRVNAVPDGRLTGAPQVIA